MNISDIKVGDKFIIEVIELRSDGGYATVLLKSGGFFLSVSPDAVTKMIPHHEPNFDEASCSICELYIKGETCEQRDTCPVAALQRQYWELLRQNKALKNELEYIFQSIIEASKRQVSDYKSRVSYIADIN